MEPCNCCGYDITINTKQTHSLKKKKKKKKKKKTENFDSVPVRDGAKEDLNSSLLLHFPYVPSALDSPRRGG
jgi:hypothetical protein